MFSVHNACSTYPDPGVVVIYLASQILPPGSEVQLMGDTKLVRIEVRDLSKVLPNQTQAPSSTLHGTHLDRVGKNQRKIASALDE